MSRDGRRIVAESHRIVTLRCRSSNLLSKSYGSGPCCRTQRPIVLRGHVRASNMAPPPLKSSSEHGGEEMHPKITTPGVIRGAGARITHFAAEGESGPSPA